MPASILQKSLYHACWTYDGSSAAAGLKLYLNGTAIALSTITNNLTSSILNSVDAFIGQFASGQFLNAKLDEVTIWSTDLTASEVLALYNGGSISDPSLHTKASDLAHYYRMGDGDTYPIISDSIGSVDGTMTNMASSSFSRDLP
jgi:hypothetical protein